MVINRGDICWAALEEPVGSGPGYRRPVVVVQSNAFNRSRIQTAIVAVLTSNLTLGAAPGNVLLPKSDSGLAKESVVNVSQVLTVDKSLLIERIGKLPPKLMRKIDTGLRLVLAL